MPNRKSVYLNRVSPRKVTVIDRHGVPLSDPLSVTDAEAFATAQGWLLKAGDPEPYASRKTAAAAAARAPSVAASVPVQGTENATMQSILTGVLRLQGHHRKLAELDRFLWDLIGNA